MTLSDGMVHGRHRIARFEIYLRPLSTLCVGQDLQEIISRKRPMTNKAEAAAKEAWHPRRRSSRTSRSSTRDRSRPPCHLSGGAAGERTAAPANGVACLRWHLCGLAWPRLRLCVSAAVHAATGRLAPSADTSSSALGRYRHAAGARMSPPAGLAAGAGGAQLAAACGDSPAALAANSCCNTAAGTIAISAGGQGKPV